MADGAVFVSACIGGDEATTGGCDDGFRGHVALAVATPARRQASRESAVRPLSATGQHEREGRVDLRDRGCCTGRRRACWRSISGRCRRRCKRVGGALWVVRSRRRPRGRSRPLRVRRRRASAVAARRVLLWGLALRGMRTAPTIPSTSGKSSSIGPGPSTSTGPCICSVNASPAGRGVNISLSA